MLSLPSLHIPRNESHFASFAPSPFCLTFANAHHRSIEMKHTPAHSKIRSAGWAVSFFAASPGEYCTFHTIQLKNNRIPTANSIVSAFLFANRCIVHGYRVRNWSFKHSKPYKPAYALPHTNYRLTLENQSFIRTQRATRVQRFAARPKCVNYSNQSASTALISCNRCSATVYCVAV